MLLDLWRIASLSLTTIFVQITEQVALVGMRILLAKTDTRVVEAIGKYNVSAIVIVVGSSHVLERSQSFLLVHLMRW